MGDSRRNIAITFGTEKLEWCGYPKSEKNGDTFIRFGRIMPEYANVTDRLMDGQTDRHRTMAYAALIRTIAAKTSRKEIALALYRFQQ